MGIDGNQYITIRGSKRILDELEQTHLQLNNLTGLRAQIAEAFFGPTNIDIPCRDKHMLVCKTHFRNQPIQEYMVELLKTHSTCWIKYEYSTEDGHKGIWIGRMNREKGEPVITERYWEELSWDEIANLEDFSISTTSLEATVSNPIDKEGMP
jgi:hypothetical protein